MSAEDESLVDFVGGDAEGARALRRALAALRDAPVVSPGLRGQVDAVLAGRVSMRDLAADPELRDIAHGGIALLREQLDDMTPDERAELVRRSRERATSGVDQR